MPHLSNSSSLNNFNSQQNNISVSQTNQNRVTHLRKQDSSYGSGHVHNMAVMVAPNRIDYSVTKGGIRSWIVLIVFILLCSSIFTIFSDNVEESEDEEIYFKSENNNDKDDLILPKDDRIENNENHNSNEIEDNDNDIDIEELLLKKLKEKANLQLKAKIESKELKKNKKNFTNLVSKHIKDNINIENNVENFAKENNNFDDLDNDLNIVKVQNNIDSKKKDLKQDIYLKRKKKLDKRQKRLEQKNNLNFKISIQAQKLAMDVLNPRKKLLKNKKHKHVLTNSIEIDDEDVNKNNNDEIENEIKEDNENDIQFNKNSKENDSNKLETSSNQIYALKKSVIYDEKSITNKDDYKYRRQLDLADLKLKKHDFLEAQKIYEEVISNNKNSPRAHFGIGRIFQLKSEFSDENEYKKISKDNKLIEYAISNYQIVLNNENTPDELYRLTAKNLIDCARWTANLHKVLTVQRELIDKFPDQLSLQVDFGITFLQMSRFKDAQNVFLNVLKIDPNNNLAQAYYGYILKTHDNDLEKGVYWMRKGLRNSKDSSFDSKFYYHLGDALTRLGREQEALKIYKKGVLLGFFPSVFQRSMHNINGLIAQPWWTVNESGCSKQLRHVERYWTTIREEALEVWNQNRLLFHKEDAYLIDGVEMILYLRKESKFLENKCFYFPNTCKILKNFFERALCGKNEVKISILFSGSRIWPHCAPTNYELEAHLGLIVPSEARIQVAQETRGWKTGQFIIFDKSFEKEIWFDGAAANAMRFILSINLWHPQVPPSFRNMKQN